MGFTWTRAGNTTNGAVMEFDCDTLADMKDLPGLGECAPGSTCLVLATSQVFRLNTKGEWIQL